MNGKIARLLLLGLLALMVYLVVLPIMRANDYNSREMVIHESLQCVSTVCVEDATVGSACSFVNPVVSKVLITVDPEDAKRRIVRIEPTNADC